MPGNGNGTFAGKAAFVTGAGSGIGRAAALAFAREGADVAVADGGQTTWRRAPRRRATRGPRGRRAATT